MAARGGSNDIRWDDGGAHIADVAGLLLQTDQIFQVDHRHTGRWGLPEQRPGENEMELGVESWKLGIVGVPQRRKNYLRALSLYHLLPLSFSQHKDLDRQNMPLILTK